MRYYVTWAGRERAVELKPVGDALVAIVDGVEHPVDVASTEEGGLLNLIVGGASYTYGCRFEDGHAVLSFHDREVRVQIEDDRERQTRLLTGGGRGGATGAKVKSSMPGVVKELRVAAGDTVAEHRVFGFRHDFAHDVDALGFQLLQVSQYCVHDVLIRSMDLWQGSIAFTRMGPVSARQINAHIVR